MSEDPYEATAAFQRALREQGDGHYVLHLYVTGATERSARAIRNLRRLCETHMPGRYEIEVIDVYQRPLLAIEGHIVAAPTLVKSAPAPLRRVIGDLSDAAKVIAALDIRVKPPDG